LCPQETITQDLEVFRAVVEHSADGVMVGAPDGRVFYANPAACGIFGLTEEEMRSRGRQGLIDSADPLWQAALDERRRLGRVRSVLPLTRANGRAAWVDLSSVIITGQDGQPQSVIVLRDVTERVQLNRRLLAHNDVTEALLAGADTAQVLAIIAEHARVIFEASDAAVVTIDQPDDAVVVTTAVGPSISRVLGRAYQAGTKGSQVIATRQSRLYDDFCIQSPTEDGRQLGLGPAMLVPILSAQEVFGILFVGAQRSRPPYTAEDLAVAETYAKRAGVALALGLARAELERHQRELVDQLQHALASRVIIEQAKGMISAVRGVTTEEAFARLRRHARDHNADIHTVAADVVARRRLV
jgi:PAS domain S-box-containing protein